MTQKYLAFTEKLNFVETVRFCEKIGGEIAVASDFYNIQQMQVKSLETNGKNNLACKEWKFNPT